MCADMHACLLANLGGLFFSCQRPIVPHSESTDEYIVVEARTEAGLHQSQLIRVTSAYYVSSIIYSLQERSYNKMSVHRDTDDLDTRRIHHLRTRHDTT